MFDPNSEFNEYSDEYLESSNSPYPFESFDHDSDYLDRATVFDNITDDESETLSQADHYDAFGLDIDIILGGSDEDAYGLDDGSDSDISLDYEFVGPRAPNIRPNLDADSDASVLSSDEPDEIFNRACHPAIDMWDEDVYDTNDSDDEHLDGLQLTRSVKALQRHLRRELAHAPWNSPSSSSFYRVEKGWPKQVPYSNSTCNHFQCANALCLAASDYGLDEQLFTIFRDRIVRCGVWADQWRVVSSVAPPSRGDSDYIRPPKPPVLRAPHSAFAISLLPYTKYISRSSFRPTSPGAGYLDLTFQPICMAHRHGYLVIGGDDGSFVVYCTMDPSKDPVKLWGTRFEGSNNIGLLTNSVQIVRWRKGHSLDEDDGDDFTECSGNYEYKVVVSVNDAGVIVYTLPSHKDCRPLHKPRRDRLKVDPVTDAYLRINQDRSAGRALQDDADDDPTWTFSGIRPPPRQNNDDLVKTDKYLPFDKCRINDAKVSPDGQWIACVGDDSMVFLVPIIRNGTTTSFEPIGKFAIHPSLLVSADPRKTNVIPYTSQYVSWNSQSSLFAHTSDTHDIVFVWTLHPRHEVLYVIPAAGATYTIAFHPVWPGVLAFTNRYGYMHTVDLSEAIEIRAEDRRVVTVEGEGMAKVEGEGVAKVVNLMEFDQMTGHSVRAKARVSEGSSTSTVASGSDLEHLNLAEHTRALIARHEVTMVSFRGERNRHMRILAKINGLVWSRDGRRLYLATKKRVLCYEFERSSRQVPSLMKLCGAVVKKAFEERARALRALVEEKKAACVGEGDVNDVDAEGGKVLGSISSPTWSTTKRRTEVGSSRGAEGVDTVHVDKWRRIGTEDNETGIVLDPEVEATGSQIVVDWERWLKKWECVPVGVKSKVFGEDFGLASHW